MRVLFVEPYYGGSHRVLLDGLRAHSRHLIEPLVLPAERWRRRMRAGAEELAACLPLEAVPDLVVATDMLDLATFLALTRRHLGGVPVLFYMHENQFTYPRLRGTRLNSWFGQINYLSAAAADAVAFNSGYHRQDFLGALSRLQEEPNNWLLPEVTAAIERKSFVLPPGLPLTRLDRQGGERPPRPVRVLWNQRWEFDRAPDMFARVIVRVASERPEMEVAVAGEPGPNPHPALLSLPRQLGPRLVHHGYAGSEREYARLLWSSHVVVSTTRHEFFGIGMVEALYCGCVPLAPDGFTYPSLIPPALHDPCLYEDEAGFEERLRALAGGDLPDTRLLRRSASRFDWSVMADLWDRALEAVAAGTLPELEDPTWEGPPGGA